VIGLGRSLRVWAYPAPCDLRNGFDGLTGLVERHLCRDVLGGDLFLFVNRSRKTSKMLFWDGTGMCILHKRLCGRGKFPRLWARPGVDLVGGIELTPNELSLFLEGCTLLEQRPLSVPDATKKYLVPQSGL
jgi:transposase